MFKTIFFSIALAISAAYASVSAQIELSPIGSFTAKSAKVRGKVVKKDDGSLFARKISVPVESFKTGINLRDDHLVKRFGGHKRIVIKNAKGNDGKGVATLKMNGVTKKDVPFTFKEQDTKVSVSLKVSLSEFQIQDINYQGIGVKDQVEITAELPKKQ